MSVATRIGALNRMRQVVTSYENDCWNILELSRANNWKERCVAADRVQKGLVDEEGDIPVARDVLCQARLSRIRQAVLLLHSDVASLSLSTVHPFHFNCRFVIYQYSVLERDMRDNIVLRKVA